MPAAAVADDAVAAINTTLWRVLFEFCPLGTPVLKVAPKRILSRKQRIAADARVASIFFMNLFAEGAPRACAYCGQPCTFALLVGLFFSRSNVVPRFFFLYLYWRTRYVGSA